MSTTTNLDSIPLAELELALHRRRAAEAQTLEKEIAALEKQLSEKRDALAKLTGAPTTTVAIGRGRKPGSLNGTGKAAKAPRKSKGKRGALGQTITEFLAHKGKPGAHVKDIAVAVGKPAANVTAWIYSTGKKLVKKTAPATFALKK